LIASTYSVSQITQYIKGQLETDPALQDLWIQGEISNWFRSRAGHCYFTLKDTEATIRSILWRTVVDELSFLPEDGQAVLAHGYVSVYAPQGQYQFYVDSMSPRGRGALYAQFERLKECLAAEGLFDADRKRPLPRFPGRIGVVTSSEGAALRDIQNVLSRRWPLVQVLLSPTLVQGDEAPRQIVQALQVLYNRHDVDVIIVARGGGSLEDLWAFNDERVGRAIAASPVPVISGIGHEIDFTITDFVADWRAPTPSAAAEVAVPDQVEVRAQVAALATAAEEAVAGCLQKEQQELDVHLEKLKRLSPKLAIDRNRQDLDGLQHRAETAVRHRCALLREQAVSLNSRLCGLDPQATLARGYAVVRDHMGQIIRSVAQAIVGGAIRVRVSDGDFAARVEEDA
jgi:exodeoxyribonuclease VII large subunit